MMRLFFALWLFIMAIPAHADELRPAYIELNQTSQSAWNIIWKASAQSPLAEGQIILPDNCKAIDEPQKRFDQNNVITHFSMTCDGDIINQSIGLNGLQFSNSDALVRISYLEGAIQIIRLTPNEYFALIETEQKSIITNVASTYTLLGFEHILEGYDHLLFVLALVLLISSLRLIAWTVTAFTLAHSITLIGTTLGYLSLPSQPVETVIALSILFLALEVVGAIKGKDDKQRLSERYPWMVAFLFGLLHGFGFAGALAEIGLPQDDVPLALLTFNLGVELGQLLIVIIALALLRIIGHFKPQYLKTVKLILAYGIGIIATYWFIERLFG